MTRRLSVDESSTAGRGTTLALVALLLASAVAPSLLAGTAAASVSSTPEMPPGFVSIPDQNVEQGTPASESFPYRAANMTDGDVLASAHASTTEVVLTTPEDAEQTLGPNTTVADGLGNLAIVIRDDSVHEGRRIAIRASEVRDALGYLPNRIAGVHEGGSRWSERVTTTSGYIVAELPHFSDNVITFTGEVEIQGNPATDGTSYQYDISDMDSARAPNLTLTGAESSEWDNVSATGLGDGESLEVWPAGHRIEGPNGSEPEVVLTGDRKTTWRTPSGSVSPGGSASISVDGNLAPASPELIVTGRGTTHTNPLYGSDDHYLGVAGQSVGEEISAEVRFDNVPDLVSGIKSYWRANGGTHTFDVYIVEETPDHNYGEGTKVASDVTISSTGTQTIDIQDYEPSNPGGDVTVEFVTTSTSGDKLELRYDDSPSKTSSSVSIYQGTGTKGVEMSLVESPSNVTVTDDTGASASVGELLPGEMKSKSLDLTTDSSTLDFSSFKSGSVDWRLEFSELAETESPALDLDGDGVDEVSHSGKLADGETVTYQAPGLSVDDDLMTVSTASGSTVDVSVKLKEVSESRNIGFELNGNWQNQSALADGETVNYAIPESWLANGTNRINVSVAPGLSADAPAPNVGIEFRHSARDDQSVEFAGESWSERYNVTRTWADVNQNATLEIPFAGNVVQTRNLRVYLNGTETAPTWSRFDNTTLEVGLGDLAPGTEARVVANGSKVRVRDGAVRVTNPTTEGNRLNTTFEVVSRGPEFRIDVSGTASSEWVHYVADPSYTNASASARIADGGASQYVRLPNAPEGGRATVRTLDLRANPQNDVVVSVADPDEPKFRIRPGEVAGDSVELAYHGGESGVAYDLVSESSDRVEEPGVTGSPVVFSLDSDKSNLLRISVSDSGGASSGGGGSDGGGGIPPLASTARSVADDPLANPLLVLGAGAAVILGVGVLARRRGVPMWASGGVLGLVFVVALESLAPGYLSGALARVVEELAAGLGGVSQFLWLAGGLVGLWALFRLVQKFTSPDRTILNIRGGK
ncbi:hypothetical protein [Halorussus lipolyticus]|uniref:hypothetical protein n=1 Tax=Halorussus lipolyticus TaxID=3034024 RepID=UPI0023E8BA02|nr:hypothetical protein [Halorussus sp. DT80]